MVNKTEKGITIKSLSEARRMDREENVLQYALGYAKRKGMEIATLNEILMQQKILDDMENWRGGVLVVSSIGAPKTRGFHEINRRNKTVKYAPGDGSFRLPSHRRVHIDLTTGYDSHKEDFLHAEEYRKLGYVPETVITSKKEHLVFLGHFAFAGEGLGVVTSLYDYHYPIKVALRKS